MSQASQNLFDLTRVRRDFPILSSRIDGHPLRYLDNAATTQKPRAVIDAISRYYQRDNANVHRAAHTLSARATSAFEAVRHQLARWIKAGSARELVWTRGTTEAINLVAQSYLRPLLQPGDRILLLESNHHANIVPWQLVAQASGAILEVVPVHDGEIDLEQCRQLLSTQPKLFALSQVSNALGTIYPVAVLCKLAKEAGVPVLIDGAQALPHFDIDVQTLGCDFYVFSAHKLFGPTGVGALWAREALLQQMPPWQGGGEMIEQVSFSDTRFAGLPFRFEAGTPDIAGVIGLGAAIDYLSQFDRGELERHEQRLLQHALDACRSIPGFRDIAAGAQRVSLLSFLIEGQHPQDIGLWLDRHGIAVRAGHHCAMPLMSALGIGGTVRASFAFYNTLEDAEQLALRLDQLVSQNRSQVAACASSDTEAALEKLATHVQQVEQASDWNSRYRALIQLGQDLPALNETLKIDQHRLHGCESRVWLVLARDIDGRLACQADADARILRALLGLLLNQVNGKTPAEVLALDLTGYIEHLDLKRHLSPSRGNGLLAMIDALLAFARTETSAPHADGRPGS